MKFKVDENLPLQVAQLLREAGHDVFTVLDQDLGGAQDRVIAQICRTERRALITLDVHFADIRTYPPAEQFGLIVLRLQRHDIGHIVRVVSRVLKMATSQPLEKQLWIVDERKIRIRE